MILYLIHDLQQNSYSHPLVGPDLSTVKLSLKQLNPENLSNLKVVVLDTLETLEDLLSLKIQKKSITTKILSSKKSSTSVPYTRSKKIKKT